MMVIVIRGQIDLIGIGAFVALLLKGIKVRFRALLYLGPTAQVPGQGGDF